MITSVKNTSTACILLAALALVPACKPQGPNMSELSELQQRNAQLRSEIAAMEALIRRAGEDTPDLADKLDARYKELVQAYENYKKLKEQETEIRMRRIELEGRLDAFRSTIREAQKQVADSSSKSQQ